MPRTVNVCPVPQRYGAKTFGSRAARRCGVAAGAAARARKGRGDLGDCVIDRHDVDDYEREYLSGDGYDALGLRISRKFLGARAARRCRVAAGRLR